jgi:hypothetical protein
MKFKDVVISEASTEAKVAALAVLLDKELLKLAETVFNTQKLQGPKGEQGLQGPKGEQGDRGFDGVNGKDGVNGQDGKDGEEGKQGVGVQDAHIDFDGALIITLTDGREINAGDVVPLDVAEKIQVIGASGGTAQSVLDAIAAIQATITTYGTMALQNDTSVDINGGAIDGTAIGASSASTGTFTTLIGGSGSANYGQLTGGATTKAVEFKTLGSDTNVAYAIRSKGTGAIDLAAGSSGVNISNGGTVTAITRTVAGTGYTSPPSVAIAAPTTAGGVQATASAFLQLAVTPTITSGGTGYSVNDVLTFSGGVIGVGSTASAVTVTSVSGGVITGISINQFGTGYSTVPSNPISVTGGTGTGATFTVSGWQVSTFTITNAGSGYVEQPTVSFSGGGGSGATAYATVGSTPKIQSLGTNLSFYTPGGEQFRVADTTSAGTSVNFIQTSGNIAGAAPRFVSVGADTNVGIVFSSKGTGDLSFRTNGTNQVQMLVAHTASAVNYVQVTGAATGTRPTISAQGSDATIGMTYNVKGSTLHAFTNSEGTQFAINATGATIANRLNVAGAAAGQAPTLSASGTDTNIDLTLTPKGTGNVKFGTYTALMGLVTTGYIEIKDSGGTVRRLAVV